MVLINVYQHVSAADFSLCTKLPWRDLIRLQTPCLWNRSSSEICGNTQIRLGGIPSFVRQLSLNKRCPTCPCDRLCCAAKPALNGLCAAGCDRATPPASVLKQQRRSPAAKATRIDPRDGTFHLRVFGVAGGRTHPLPWFPRRPRPYPSGRARPGILRSRVRQTA